MKREIKLRIHEESDLFSPYDPDQMQLSEDMVTYLKRKSEMMYKKNKEAYTLHIFRQLHLIWIIRRKQI